MKIVVVWAMIAGMGLGAYAADPGDDETTKISTDQLPPLVAQAINHEFEKPVLLTAKKEERNDYVHYYVTLLRQGKEWMVEVLENGTVVKKEMQKAK